MPTTDPIDLARDLIRRPSETPDDAGCQALLARHLAPLGFAVASMPYGQVSNLWAVRGTSGPLLVFAGHTDVVPAGPLADWRHPPYDAVVDADMLYGRGAADMKGSLAAMVVACERFVAAHPDHAGRIGLLITSDEEGPAVDGTVRVVEELLRQGERIDWCVVGEPSSGERIGDTIKNGRRGSLNARLTVRGQQGHVAYPHLADNPIHRTAPAIAELATTVWDQGNDHFPPTTFQVSNIRSGTGATNVIPGAVEILFNVRFSTALTEAAIRERVEATLQRHRLDYALSWTLSGEPFLTAAGALVDASRAAVREVTGYEPELSTSGGTSDGRFIAPTGAEVVELRPCNATIHKVNECVAVADIRALTDSYDALLRRLLLPR